MKNNMTCHCYGKRNFRRLRLKSREKYNAVVGKKPLRLKHRKVIGKKAVRNWTIALPSPYLEKGEIMNKKEEIYWKAKINIDVDDEADNEENKHFDIRGFQSYGRIHMF